jgi:hypothetical protein
MASRVKGFADNRIIRAALHGKGREKTTARAALTKIHRTITGYDLAGGKLKRVSESFLNSGTGQTITAKAARKLGYDIPDGIKRWPVRAAGNARVYVNSDGYYVKPASDLAIRYLFMRVPAEIQERISDFVGGHFMEDKARKENARAEILAYIEEIWNIPARRYGKDTEFLLFGIGQGVQSGGKAAGDPEQAVRNLLDFYTNLDPQGDTAWRLRIFDDTDAEEEEKEKAADVMASFVSGIYLYFHP